MEKRLFRDAMGKFATGITVVSTNYQNEVKGITVNSFMSLSLDPTLIAISIDKTASMYDILQEANTFGISVLSENQKEESMIYANQKEVDQPVKFTDLAGTPVLNNALVQLSCEKESAVEAGDHMIFIAKVNDLKISDGNPLLYFSGSYQQLDK
ncbi:flavin reductase family protein [Paraliobacillus sp. X-1268]|uniref:flavin reductase family protein n=1 Tax=Paraliobacillus sp. X-1268 TaxID=2213193 RepID=UPI000E3E0DDE|nr:flavin reductase family protein [Paraliobacillus sp. X-1268]